MRHIVLALGLTIGLGACQSGGDPAESLAKPVAAAPVLEGALKVSRRDVVTIEPALAAAVADLHAKALRPRPERAPENAYADIVSAFADKVTVFSRSLDPLQPWNKLSPKGQTPFNLALSFLVEQGDQPYGAPIPDYRPDLMKVLADHTAPDQVFGMMKELPGAVCSDAQWTVDLTAARAFAAKTGDEVSSLQFLKTDQPLFDAPKPNARVIGTLAANTVFLMAPGNAVFTDGWRPVIISTGTTGWLPDTAGDYDGLSQQHICFAKGSDGYKISAFFAYGL